MEIEITRAVALISINATLVAQLLSFLIFMILISRLMYHPLQEIMTERDRQMEQIKKDIEAAEADLDEILSAIEVETQKVRGEAYDAQNLLEKEATQQADELFAQVNADIAGLDAETKEEVRRQVEDVRQHLGEESERVSRTIMEKILDRRLAYE